MIDGHGDDSYKYDKEIVSNFSSNVFNRVNLSGLKAHLCECMSSISSYPEPEPYSLEKHLAEVHQIRPESVCVTNGATEAIYLIAQLFQNSVSTIIVPTFSEYADACRMHHHKVVELKDWQGIRRNSNIVWLCNPNNPTGQVFDKQALVDLIISRPQTTFIIDQSYEYFTEKELLSARKAVKYANVMLLHSMTKRYAIPGLRLGYVTAHPLLLRKLRKQRMPWSVNQLAMEAGHYLLDTNLFNDINIPAYLKEKQCLESKLSAIDALTVLPSDVHFMLVKLNKGIAAHLKEYLANEYGILIRDASNFTGLNESYFRIATQTREENEKLVEAIKLWLATL